MRRITDKLAEIKNEQPIDYAGMMAKIRDERPVSYSSLKHFAKSPWHFWEYYHGEKKESTSFDIGNAFELMLLQPEKVDDHIIIAPEFNKRTKEGREAWEQFKAANAGKLIVAESEMEASFEMYRRAINDEKLMALVNRRTMVQHKFYWSDHKTGLRNVGIIDFATGVDEPDFAIVDLKTAISATPADFAKAVTNFDYWLQAGGYSLGFKRKYFAYPDFYWIVVENKPPYAINIFKADPKLIYEGEQYYEKLLKALDYCYKENLWHLSHSFWHFTQPYDNLYKSPWIKTRI